MVVLFESMSSVLLVLFNCYLIVFVVVSVLFAQNTFQNILKCLFLHLQSIETIFIECNVTCC